MTDLVHDFIFQSAARAPAAEALVYQSSRLNYAELANQVESFAAAMPGLGLGRRDRLAVYLEKRVEAVVAMFGSAMAGAAFVPVNPLLKPEQVAYILSDCNVKVLVTSGERLNLLLDVLPDCKDLLVIVIVGAGAGTETDRVTIPGVTLIDWRDIPTVRESAHAQRGIDSDMAAILYTSGSTGHPKGVVLSHRNLVAGAKSVASYLENTKEDRILSVLPLSFDYGLSQLTTAFHRGACVVLMNYLFPRDIVRAVEEERITGLAAVPPLWMQLAQQPWPATTTLRYLTNSGGAMQRATLDRLRRALPDVSAYLMYGLTEAFRSTFLPPSELDRRPDSIGKAIPNAEVMAVRADGTLCGVDEPGELVHRGALVSLGYWNDPVKTAERFRPAPGQDPGLPMPEIAVWSGDTVRMDRDGFFYFVGRGDDMIKVSGYRISPTEVEEVIHACDGVGEAVALGLPHPAMGQAIVVLAVPGGQHAHPLSAQTILEECRRRLPAYMVPAQIEIRKESLPRNPNGKIDRKSLQASMADLFMNPTL
ncbi:MAG: acyl--CoA ligase [Herminiimonas sp.]|nr:acyl--CoA ligase [Herminiimonas sp.]